MLVTKRAQTIASKTARDPDVMIVVDSFVIAMNAKIVEMVNVKNVTNAMRGVKVQQ